MTNNEIVSYFMKDDENDKDPYYDSLVIPTYTMHPIPVPQESDDDEMQHDEKNRPKIENPAVMQQMQQEQQQLWREKKLLELHPLYLEERLQKRYEEMATWMKIYQELLERNRSRDVFEKKEECKRSWNDGWWKQYGRELFPDDPVLFEI